MRERSTWFVNLTKQEGSSICEQLLLQQIPLLLTLLVSNLAPPDSSKPRLHLSGRYVPVFSILSGKQVIIMKRVTGRQQENISDL